MKSKMKNRIYTLLRLLIAVSLLVYLFQKIGLDEIAIVLSSLNPIYFIALLLMFSLDALLRSNNWNILLRIKNYQITLLEILYNYLAGGFFGTFIPSSLGTDASRAYLIARRNHISAQDSAIAILVLNLVGLLALCIIGILSSVLLLNILPNSTFVWPVVLICFTYIMLFPLMLRGWMPEESQLHLTQIKWLTDKIRRFSIALRGYNDHRTALIKISVIALLNQILGIFIAYTVSLALNLDIPLHLFFAFIPLVVLSRLIPISIAGLGGEQGIFVFLFAQVGIPFAESFLISLVLSVMNICFTSLGGIFFALVNFKNLLHQESHPGS
jgi:glycosyltransferase 2 family protein